MEPIWIFRHIEFEGPAYLADVLHKNALDYRIIAVDQGEPIPSNINDTSALVFMGGPMSVNDDDLWIQQEVALIQTAISANLPLLGHCLGGQLISKALGAAVIPNPVSEIGWHPVRKIPSTTTDRWLPTFHSATELYHWHGETFELPEQVTPLLASEFCQNQAYAKGNILALQCHVEMRAEMVAEWADYYKEQIQTPTNSIQSKQQMCSNLTDRIKAAQGVADQLYSYWLRQAKLID